MSNQELNHPRSQYIIVPEAGNAPPTEGHYKKYPISLRPQSSVTTLGVLPKPRGEEAHVSNPRRRDEARISPLTCSRVTWN